MTDEKKEKRRLTRKDRPSFLKPASKDDPVYKIGSVVGEKNSSHFSQTTQEKTSNKEKKKPEK